MQFDAHQNAAIVRALDGRDMIITGSAGTGKTSIIKAIADGFAGQETMLLAPTGKAAARLKEATGYFAQTIHRALGWDGTAFRAPPRIDTTRVIVDEASMLDSWLMARLIEANPRQLVLVGDPAQLPPVGKGQPFHDLIKLRPGIVSHLVTCYRSQEAVHAAANAIRAGKAPSPARSERETFSIISCPSGAVAQNIVVDWIDKGALDFSVDIVLAPRYGDEDSDGDIIAINNAILARVNPHMPGEKWKTGDRVICNKNFGPLDLWNGDLGTVTDVDVDGRPYIQLDRERAEGVVHASKSEIERELSFAYCLSVHKSQGSQWRRVVFICLEKHRFVLSRQLVYTAVTRAKSGCCVLGDMSALYSAINNVAEKTTCLQLHRGNR